MTTSPARSTVNGTNITVTLSDSTTGQSATKNLTMQNPDTSSAEWIAEAPSQCGNGSGCQPLPLTDFGKVDFTDASATANGHTGTISDSAWASNAVQLSPGASQLGDGGGFVSADTSSAGATPSNLSSDGSAFSVTWGSSAQPAAGSGSSAGSGWGEAAAPPGATARAPPGATAQAPLGATAVAPPGATARALAGMTAPAPAGATMAARPMAMAAGAPTSPATPTDSPQPLTSCRTRAPRHSPAGSTVFWVPTGRSSQDLDAPGTDLNVRFTTGVLR